MVCHYCGSVKLGAFSRRIKTFGGDLDFCSESCLDAHRHELQALVRQRRSLQWLQELKRCSVSRSIPHPRSA
jgi:hypothetical protein